MQPFLPQIKASGYGFIVGDKMLGNFNHQIITTWAVAV